MNKKANNPTEAPSIPIVFKDFQGQNYAKIKAECVKTNKLFEDDKFPANNTSLFKFNQKYAQNVTWRRPFDILKNKPVYEPVFVKEKIRTSDIRQAEDLGNFWFISALREVAAKERDYIKVVVPQEDQSFVSGEYAGIFRFRFWKNGEWLEVVVDDNLPVHGNDSTLKFCRNTRDECEMFAPLLEKAYAKLAGCYEFLEGGDIVDAITDMTGGVHERIKMQTTEPDSGEKMSDNAMWETLFKAFEMKSLAGASSNSDSASRSNGISNGHAYSVLGAYELLPPSPDSKKIVRYRKSFEDESNQKAIKLIKLRNPWGQNETFTGAWNNDAAEWSNVSDELKQELKLTPQEKKNKKDNDNGGVFFMLFEEFIKSFDNLDFVHVNLNAFFSKSSDYNFNVNWYCEEMRGEWNIERKTAGGCGNLNKDDFWMNPQLIINLTLENKNDLKVSTIVSLMQTDTLSRRQLETNGSYIGVNLPINFAVYRVKNHEAQSATYKMDQLEKVADCMMSYSPQRCISCRLNLDPGFYVVIPSTFEKEKESRFLLRVFSEGKNTSKVIKYKNVIDDKAEDLIDKLPENKAGKMVDNVYHKAKDNIINPAGAVVSRACLLM